MAKRTYDDLEGGDEEQLPLLPPKKLTKQQMLEVLRAQAHTQETQATLIHELLQKVLGPQHSVLREQEERRIRDLARSVVQEELFDNVVPPVARKKADRSQKAPRPLHDTYPDPVQFEVKLRETIGSLCDPEQLDKLTINRVLCYINVSPNNLWSLLKDYGYVHVGETCSRCLNRLADEWYPQWRGVNRQRF